MTAALLGMFAAAIMLAWVLAAKQPGHRPVAVLLSVGLASDVITRVLDLALIAPLRASLGVGVPWTGWHRIAGLVYSALGLVWPTAIVAAVLVVFAGRKPWGALIGWAIAVLLLGLVHPIGARQASFLAALQVVASLTSAGVVLSWYRRRKVATSAQFALTMIVMAEVVSLLGAWTLGPFVAWPVSQVLYLLMFAIVVLVQGRFLWSSPQQQPSA